MQEHCLLSLLAKMKENENEKIKVTVILSEKGVNAPAKIVWIQRLL